MVLASVHDIERLLESVPEERRHLPHSVRHFFVGPESKLKSLRAKIKKSSQSAKFQLDDGGLTVVIDSHLSRDDLAQLLKTMQTYAIDHKVQYEGLEIGLSESVEIEHFAIRPFEKHFAPGSYCRFKLSPKSFSYVLFVGGNANSGHLFDCINLVDNGASPTSLLSRAPRLYRQPVLGAIDPGEVELVGKADPATLPKRVSFRLINDTATEAEIAAVARKCNLPPDEVNANWPRFLQLVHEKGFSLRRGTSTEYIAVLKRNNRIQWITGGTIDFSKAYPMPFGTIIRLKWLRETLLGGADIMALTDAVM